MYSSFDVMLKETFYSPNLRIINKKCFSILKGRFNVFAPYCPLYDNFLVFFLIDLCRIMDCIIHVYDAFSIKRRTYYFNNLDMELYMYMMQQRNLNQLNKFLIIYNHPYFLDNDGKRYI